MSRQPDLELGAVNAPNDDRSDSRSFREQTSEGRKGYRATVSSGTAAKNANSTRRRRALHRDAFGREPTRKESKALNDDSDEVFLDPSDGRLRILKVQTRSKTKEQREWQQVRFKNASKPSLLSMVDGTFRSSATAALLYVPAIFMTTFCLFLFARIELELQNHGFYDPVLYRNWRAPGIGRKSRDRQQEEKIGNGNQHAAADEPLPNGRGPQVVSTDSDFMALARKSLSSKSDATMERLLCMQPSTRDTEWHQMTDAWGAQIHDIEPSCRIASIDNDRSTQTVVLDGVHGASINWSRMEPVARFSQPTMMRRLTTILLPKAPYILLIGALLTALLAGAVQSVRDNSNTVNNINQFVTSAEAFPPATTATRTVLTLYSQTTTNIFGQPQTIGGLTSATITTTITPTTTFHPTITPVSNQPTFAETTDASLGVLGFYLACTCIMMAGSLATLIAGPALLRNLYRGDFSSTQARFYGVGGYCDLATLNRNLFGPREQRLRWSTATSLHSRPIHDELADYDDEGLVYEGADPNSPSPLPERDAEGRYLFTLVDTYVMEASVFYAERPPTVVMICGSEGGMQRAVLCSYHWRTQTFCREVVLRMKTVVLNRMAKVDQFRFALRR